jgi:hypothetical protein
MVIVQEHTGEVVRVNWGGKVFKLELGFTENVKQGLYWPSCTKS